MKPIRLTEEGAVTEPRDADGPEAIEVYDSQAYFLVCLTLLVIVGIFSLAAGVALGALLCAPYAIWCGYRLVSHRVRVRISKEGILDDSFWQSAGFIPWDEVIDVRMRGMGLIQVVVDESLVQRLPPLSQLAALKGRIFGFPPLILSPWNLDVTAQELYLAIEDGMERFALETVREAQEVPPTAERAELRNADSPVKPSPE